MSSQKYTRKSVSFDTATLEIIYREQQRRSTDFSGTVRTLIRLYDHSAKTRTRTLWLRLRDLLAAQQYPVAYAKLRSQTTATDAQLLAALTARGLEVYLDGEATQVVGWTSDALSPE